MISEDEFKMLAGSYHDNCSLDQLEDWLDNVYSRNVELQRLSTYRSTDYTDEDLLKIINKAVEWRYTK